jgi:transcription antitermination factor NusA-like protein
MTKEVKKQQQQLQNIPNEPKPNVIVEQTTTTTVEEIVTTKEENSDNGELEIKCIKKI